MSGASKKVLRIGNYILGETLGHGTFGKVKIAEHRLTGHRVAVKIMSRETISVMNMKKKVKREIDVLKLLRHPHIIRLYEVIYTPSDIFMIMEYVPGGELFEYIVKNGRLPEADARRFFQQLIAGLAYCHQHLIVHRDLKPENLLLDADNNVKIADFGLSNTLEDGSFNSTSCGSPNYAAPEVVSGRAYSGEEVDVWSSGVILYALLCGRLPFDDEYIPNLFKKIKGGIFTLPSFLSDDARDLILAMLCVDPLRRISVDQIMAHPWFVTDLPAYLAAPPTPVLSLKEIDEAVLAQVADRLDMPYDEAHAALSAAIGAADDDPVAPDAADASDAAPRTTPAGPYADPRSAVVVAYRLMLDASQSLASQRRGGGTPMARRAVANQRRGDGAASVAASPPSWNFQEDLGRRAGHGGPPGSAVVSARTLSYSRYTLGVRSSCQPKRIMHELYGALRALAMEWQVVTPYQLCARYVDRSASAAALRLVITVYEIGARVYVIDFMRRKGSTMAFISATGALVDALAPIRTTSAHEADNS